MLLVTWYVSHTVHLVRCQPNQWNVHVDSHPYPGEDARLACSQDSGCINYLTQIECLESECRCRHMCRNQRWRNNGFCKTIFPTKPRWHFSTRLLGYFRFQKREYALIDIVQTERKGYGIRLREDVDAWVLLTFCLMQRFSSHSQESSWIYNLMVRFDLVVNQGHIYIWISGWSRRRKIFSAKNQRLCPGRSQALLFHATSTWRSPFIS